MFAEIIIDIAHANVDRLFTYRVPEELSILPGQHVLVPFGHGNAQKEGFVLSLTETLEADYPLKDVLRAIEPHFTVIDRKTEKGWVALAAKRKETAALS